MPYGRFSDRFNPAGNCSNALKSAVETGSDRSLNRVNPLAFAAERGLNEEAVIGALVHAARLGLFDMSWNMLCPGGSVATILTKDARRWWGGL